MLMNRCMQNLQPGLIGFAHVPQMFGMEIFMDKFEQRHLRQCGRITILELLGGDHRFNQLRRNDNKTDAQPRE